jgi:hypothetical protein
VACTLAYWLAGMSLMPPGITGTSFQASLQRWFYDSHAIELVPGRFASPR